MGRWAAPQQGWHKANWVAALDCNQGLLGGVVVIRDHNGSMVAAHCWVRRGWMEPTVAEAMAAGIAVRTCKDLGITRVHFEGDVKAVVDAVNCDEENKSRIGLVVKDIQTDARNFINWRMSFISRESNNAAHLLAKYAVKHYLEKMWVLPPDCIRDLLLVEQFALSA